ncbi:unnamed protein product [Lupinus luteus]|uniref:Zinc finger CCCH domain-containing protein 5 n=1 Tax=Lupinus luteus TaxID=3873 RepID=A0AAV1WL07_LUPLU
MEVGGEMEEEKKSRKEKRKEKKRKKRKELAAKERQEREALLNDPQEQIRLQLIEQLEFERMERDRKEFEEREKAYQQKLLLQSNLLLEQQQQDHDDDKEEEEGEGEEEGEEELPQIIWKGNEIIFNKPKNKNDTNNNNKRPTSNPLPPPQENGKQQQVEEIVAPNFGTELDKAHCPFHLKTGACRFGQRCSRVHFYPDYSSTLLIKNMYNAPQLDHDHDEALEYTDEEVERCYEEFYEDVHTEFLKFGEIVNFKVCKNGAVHLRGNVYVQYKSLDSALLAYNSVNGRYFAGKQISCNFVNLTRWKVAICGEYMRSGFKTCSHGTACNFIHCFRNPGGDYEWADLDKPPPKYWVKEMAALFGYSDNYENSREREILSVIFKSSKISETDSDRYHSIRSRSREMVHLNSGRSGRRKYEDETRQGTLDEERSTSLKDSYKMKRRIPDTDSGSDREWLEKEGNREKHHKHVRKSSFSSKNDDNSRSYEKDSDTGWANITRDTEKQLDREGRNSGKSYRDDRDLIYEVGSDGDRDGKRHRSSKRKSSRHESSRDNRNVTSESESDKDSVHRRDMETKYGYSRKS